MKLPELAVNRPVTTCMVFVAVLVLLTLLVLRGFADPRFGRLTPEYSRGPWRFRGHLSY